MIAVFAIILVVAIVAAVTFPQFAQGGNKRQTCFSRSKQMATALLLYAVDADQHLPLAATWADDTLPHIKDKKIYACETVAREWPGKFGFAFRALFSQAKLASISDLSQKVLVFESNDLSWNAHGPLTQMPQPGRHSGRDCIAFADGHVKTCRPEELLVAGEAGVY